MIFIIILIIFLILIILFLKKNEGLQMLSSEVYNNINFICDKDTQSYFNRLDISSTSKIKNNNLKKYIFNQVYPIGSFYVQYPDSDINYSSSGANIITPFPEDKTPAKMFGGKWIEMWNNESVYFRTGTDNTPAFETIDVCDTDISNNNSCDNKKNINSRIDGFQNYALRDMSGWTSWSQGPYGAENVDKKYYPYGEKYDCTKDENDDYVCKQRTGYPSCYGNSGVFTKCETKTIRTDKGRDIDQGHQNIYDSTYFFKEKYGDQLYRNYISDDEVRVKNRLIKVWKRIE
jgi:hypothetical protein